jgi:hypothetical protein
LDQFGDTDKVGGLEIMSSHTRLVDLELMQADTELRLADPKKHNQ